MLCQGSGRGASDAMAELADATSPACRGRLDLDGYSPNDVGRARSIPPPLGRTKNAPAMERLFPSPLRQTSGPITNAQSPKNKKLAMNAWCDRQREIEKSVRSRQSKPAPPAHAGNAARRRSPTRGELLKRVRPARGIISPRRGMRNQDANWSRGGNRASRANRFFPYSPPARRQARVPEREISGLTRCPNRDCGHPADAPAKFGAWLALLEPEARLAVSGRHGYGGGLPLRWRRSGPAVFFVARVRLMAGRRPFSCRRIGRRRPRPRESTQKGDRNALPSRSHPPRPELRHAAVMSARLYDEVKRSRGPRRPGLRHAIRFAHGESGAS